jgi:protein phosphatase
MATDTSPDTIEFTLPPLPSMEPGVRPVSAPARVDLAAVSHQGRVRSNNEDSYLAVRTARSMQTLLTNLPAGLIPAQYEEVGYGMLVADGVGGMAAGEVAGRLAVTTLVNLFLDTPDWIMRVGDREGEEILRRITERYRQVDAVLREEAAKDPELSGMGTTMTLAFSLGTDLFLGHVGDSRAYFRRGEVLHQLTRDHTYAQELVNNGILFPDEMRTHRFRHVLTRALGGKTPPADADVQRLRLDDGDQVLLCTDGLTDMVEDTAIAEVLRGAGTAAEACHTLVDLALDNGGKDNVTVVLARYRFAPVP